ncbi:MAG: cytochrome ubiquinol oxidase subunit I [Bacteroidota bacterium]|nr:cytochrome ubiquinol oxidase subunit I [Bacteroidota bacterium]
MIEHIDLSVVNWSRAQFALTAIYHWLFVPITLGLSFIIAIMESIYLKTGSDVWKKITKFWMNLFGINFAIGAATGIILEFEFGTNWSKYSWFVGDIFGAPLATEGIMAFFLETAFIIIMFFGWNKVGKRFHLLSTWLVAIGASLSALWILVANAWMQYPVGMHFNPDTARNEMVSFKEVILSPVAINKFFHTISSGFVISALFVIAVSSWFLLKNRNIIQATKSIKITSIFGLATSLMLAYTGDGSARMITQKQPAKLAACEGLFYGKKEAGLIVFGLLNPNININDTGKKFIFKAEIPKMLSFLGFRSAQAFVPGINDLIKGNDKEKILSATDKISKGKIAINALALYKKAKMQKNPHLADSARKVFELNYPYFGYGFLNNPQSIIPNVPITFYSFHIMVGLGFYFIALFLLILVLAYKRKLINKRYILWISIISLPLGFLASQAGWIVTEMGRQPWAIQDILPTIAAVSNIDASSVMITFFLFALIFTTLLIAEIKIMLSQIKKGMPE